MTEKTFKPIRDVVKINKTLFISIPKDIAEKANIKTGIKVSVKELNGKIIIEKVDF